MSKTSFFPPLYQSAAVHIYPFLQLSLYFPAAIMIGRAAGGCTDDEVVSTHIKVDILLVVTPAVSHSLFVTPIHCLLLHY